MRHQLPSRIVPISSVCQEKGPPRSAQGGIRQLGFSTDTCKNEYHQSIVMGVKKPLFILLSLEIIIYLVLGAEQWFTPNV